MNQNEISGTQPNAKEKHISLSQYFLRLSRRVFLSFSKTDKISYHKWPAHGRLE